MRSINLKGLFTPHAIASSMEQLAPIKSTVIDLAFPNSKNHPLPHIGVAEMQRVVKTIPLVKRDGSNIKQDSATADFNIFAPLPVMPSVDVLASELNDLQMLTGTAKDEWVTAKIDELRQIVRKTTEAMASVVLTTGKLSWPVQLTGGGVDLFSIDYGSPLSYTPAKLWSATDASIVDLYNTLSDIDEALQDAGFGGKVEFMLGREAFGAAIKIAQAWATAGASTPLPVTLEDGSIKLAGYTMYRMTERYDHPVTGAPTYKLSPNALVGYVKDSSNAMIYYCAVDSLSANNQALPFHVHTEEKRDTVIELTAQAKPVPARNPKTVCNAIVVG